MIKKRNTPYNKISVGLTQKEEVLAPLPFAILRNLQLTHLILPLAARGSEDKENNIFFATLLGCVDNR